MSGPPPTRWALAGPDAAAGFGRKFAELVASGQDVDGEARLADTLLPRGGRVLDVGARTRLFTGATRRAIEVRDRHCTHPTCDVPAARCHIDHLTPWEHGGPTTQRNGDCKCPHHHRLRHRSRRSNTLRCGVAPGLDGDLTTRWRLGVTGLC